MSARSRLAQKRRQETAGVGFFGYFPKEEAEQLLGLLLRAGVEAHIGFDPAVSELHGNATRVNPVLRRRSSYHDVKSGYYVEVPRAAAAAARAAVAGTHFDDTIGAAAGPTCAQCDRPLPKGSRLCPHCSGDDDGDDQDHVARANRRGHLSTWIVVALAIVTVVVVVGRMLR